MTVAEAKEKVSIAIQELNDAISSDKKGSSIAELELAAKSAVKDLNEAVKLETFAKLRKSETPMLDAIMILEYPVYHVKTATEKGVVISYSLTDGMRNIEILELDKFINGKSNIGKTIATSATWIPTLEKFSFLLALYVGLSEKMDVDQIRRRYNIPVRALNIDLGGTPVSKTQITKMFQEVVNTILFIDNGNGKNKIHVTSVDTNHLLNNITGPGKGNLTTKFSRVGTIRDQVVQIMHKILTHSSYKLGCTMKKADAADNAISSIDDPMAPDTSSVDVTRTKSKNGEIVYTSTLK